MAIQAIDLNATEKYVSQYDTGEEKTVWILGTLDTRIRTMIEDIAWEYEASPNAPGDAKAKASFNLGKSQAEFVQFGLKGIENLKCGNKDVPFKTQEKNVNGVKYQVVSEEIMQIIPGNVMKELAEKIKELNQISEEERKN